MSICRTCKKDKGLQAFGKKNGRQILTCRECRNKQNKRERQRYGGSLELQLAGRHKQMMARCYDPNHKDYPRYGGRRVRVEKWLRDKGNYTKFLLALGFKSGDYVDRTNNDGNYKRSNLRLATPSQSAQNRDSVVNITAWGEVKCQSGWAWDARARVTAPTIGSRLARGWSAESAIATPAYTRPQLAQTLGTQGTSTAVPQASSSYSTGTAVPQTSGSL